VASRHDEKRVFTDQAEKVGLCLSDVYHIKCHSQMDRSCCEFNFCP